MGRAGRLAIGVAAGVFLAGSAQAKFIITEGFEAFGPSPPSGGTFVEPGTPGVTSIVTFDAIGASDPRFAGHGVADLGDFIIQGGLFNIRSFA